jgi:hypothetical protein
MLMRRVGLSLLLAGWTTLRLSAQTPWQIQLQAYGAVCDGNTDDTVAIQTAFDAAANTPGKSAEIVWPDKFCRVNSTVTIGKPGQTSFVSIRGVSPVVSQLVWGGPSTGTALLLARNKNFRIQGFGVRNLLINPKGTTVGIVEGGNGAPYGGTTTLAAAFDDVNVYNFHTGIAGGGNFGDASEIVYKNLTLGNNDVGWQGTGFNTLDHIFLSLSCSANAICVDTGASENFHVYGGSSSSNTDTVFLASQQGTVSITGWRSEGDRRVLRSAAGSAITITSCECNQAVGDLVQVEATQFKSLTLLGNRFAGSVKFTSASLRAVTMIGNAVKGDPATGLPVFVTPSSAGGAHLYAINNLPIVYGEAAYINYDGYLRNVQNTNTGQWYVALLPSWTVVRDDPATPQTVSPFGVDLLRLQRVRMLAEGTTTQGNNLRVQTTFPAAGSVAVSFQRPITFSANGAEITATNGSQFSVADLGKRFFAAGVGTNGATDYVGFVATYVSPTKVTIIPANPNGYFSCCGRVTGPALIGENEPDANYLPVVSCTAPEPIGWSTLAATGFTLTSTNATSTATCNVLIVR